MAKLGKATLGAVRDMQRLLLWETAQAILILWVVLRYSDRPELWVLVLLLVLPVFLLALAAGLGKFKEKKWVRWATAAFAYGVLFVLAIITRVIFGLMILAAFELGALVLGLVLFFLLAKRYLRHWFEGKKEQRLEELRSDKGERAGK
jgi:uncharacterized membrane protein YdjX (TVP38/TMEM64 family)